MNSDFSPNPPRSNPLEFESIGPYKVLGILGQGGMGTVYKAVHAKSGTVVAVKVIAAAMAQHQRFRRRFDAEIQTLVKLKHPGIVQLIGFGEERGQLFYSMEYVDGENLQQLLRREKSLSWERLLDVAIEVCAALKHAHDFGVIHRDLKPANLMLTSDNRVKLTDFGIAKLYGAADSTVEGAVLGTADFMSPEQAEGKPVTVRSDIYALGSVCYASLTGRAPFQGKSIPEVLFNVRYGTYPKLKDIVPNVPKEITDLVEELLERDTLKRPPTILVVGNRFQSIRVGLKNRPNSSRSQAEPVDVSKLKELTSIDIDESGSILQGLSDEDGTVMSGKFPKESHSVQLPEDAHLPDSQKKSSRPNAASPSKMSAGPNDKTLVQHSKSENLSLAGPADRPSGIDFIKNTTFTEVNDDDRRRSATTFNTTEEKSVVSHWIAVGILAVLLLGCIGVLIFMLQAPSANTLYRSISAAIEADEPDQWLDAEPAAQRFLDQYPEDPRVSDAEATLREAESVRMVRQLQRKAKRGNAEDLSAIEQAFLECIKAQSLGAESAVQKLEAFLVMFSEENATTDRQKSLVSMARRTLSEIQSSQKVSTHEAYNSLKDQMDWADANLSSTQKTRWLQSMVELFSEKPWAKQLVQRATRELTTPDNSKP